jgi:hypothetical protein
LRAIYALHAVGKRKNSDFFNNLIPGYGIVFLSAFL